MKITIIYFYSNEKDFYNICSRYTHKP